MFKQWKPSTLPLVGTLLGVTLSTFAAWYYTRKISGAQKPITPGRSVLPAENPSASNLLALPSVTGSDHLPPLHDGTPNANTPALPDTTQSAGRRVSRKSFESLQPPHAGPSEQYHVGNYYQATQATAQQHCVVTYEPTQEISVTMQPKTFEFAEQRYQDCINHLNDLSIPLEVRVTIKPGSNWSLSNLRHLGRAFARLVGDDHKRLCKTLAVKLPNDELESIEGVADLFLPGIVSLTWQSHPDQLPLIGVQLDNFERFEHLTNLVLVSSLSSLDCATLLRCASKTLEVCDIKMLIDSIRSAFPRSIYKKYKEPIGRDFIMMPNLTSLSIESALCPGSMLRRFRFPVLTNLKLYIEDGFVDPKRDMYHIPWLILQKVSMDCTFVKGGADWVREEARQARVLDFSLRSANAAVVG